MAHQPSGCRYRLTMRASIDDTDGSEEPGRMQLHDTERPKHKRPGKPGLYAIFSIVLDDLKREFGARRGHKEASYRADIIIIFSSIFE